MWLSFSSSIPNGVCVASFYRVQVYQWDHEVFPLTKGMFQILHLICNFLCILLPVAGARGLNNSEA